jgi:hypothetical protein
VPACNGRIAVGITFAALAFALAASFVLALAASFIMPIFVHVLVEEVAVLAVAFLAVQKLSAVLGGAEAGPEDVPIQREAVHGLDCNLSLIGIFEDQVRAVHRSCGVARHLCLRCSPAHCHSQ